MEALPRTLLDLRITIDLEVEWDSFKGRTKEQFIQLLEDDVHDAIRDTRPEIEEIYRIQIQEHTNV